MRDQNNAAAWISWVEFNLSTSSLHSSKSNSKGTENFQFFSQQERPKKIGKSTEYVDRFSKNRDKADAMSLLQRGARKPCRQTD